MTEQTPNEVPMKPADPNLVVAEASEVVRVAPKVEKVLTTEEIVVRYKELADQTRAAGLSLVGMTVKTYLNRIGAMADDALAGLEGSSADGPTKKA